MTTVVIRVKAGHEGNFVIGDCPLIFISGYIFLKMCRVFISFDMFEFSVDKFWIKIYTRNHTVCPSMYLVSTKPSLKCLMGIDKSSHVAVHYLQMCNGGSKKGEGSG